MLSWRVTLLVLLASFGIVGGTWALRPASGLPPIPERALVQELAGLRVGLQISEAQPGSWTVDVWVRDRYGGAGDVQAVAADFAMPLICTTEVRPQLMAIAPGHFQAQGAVFPMSGTWSGNLRLQRAGAEVQTAFYVPLRVPLGFTPPTPTAVAGADGLHSARLLYETHCLSCHGAQGRGDGPQAAGLRSPPADFSEHMVLGKHSDPQVFLLIHSGVTGSDMRGFKDELTPEEIWQLVAYLRTFARPQ